MHTNPQNNAQPPHHLMSMLGQHPYHTDTPQVLCTDIPLCVQYIDKGVNLPPNGDTLGLAAVEVQHVNCDLPHVLGPAE